MNSKGNGTAAISGKSERLVKYHSIWPELMVNCCFEARWFGIRIGAPTQVTILFIRGFQESKPPGPKPTIDNELMKHPLKQTNESKWLHLPQIGTEHEKVIVNHHFSNSSQNKILHDFYEFVYLDFPP